MKYYNKYNILHRDLKPDNIIINFPLVKNNDNINNKADYFNFNMVQNLDFDVKIIDFGMSKIQEEKNDMELTVVGSPYNMDPKILDSLIEGNGQKVKYDFSADIWSLAIMCYFLMFKNVYPFPANSRKILQKMYTKGEYRIPKECSSQALDLGSFR